MSKTILCLHGYAMNSDWLRQWLAPIEAALADRAELIYPQGPIACPEAEVRAMAKQYQVAVPETRIGSGQNWCWYRATNDKPPAYLQLQETLAYMDRYFSENGPIDGVLGWSQGAVMAAVMAALQESDAVYDFGFKWAVLCGGFLPGDPEVKCFFESQLELPSLHVLGKKESEFMQQRGKQLHAAFRQADLLETPVGHVMPVQHPGYMLQIADWMKARLG